VKERLAQVGEIALVVLVVFAGITAGMAYFFDGLPGWKVAILFVSFGLIIVTTVIACLKFFVATLNARERRYGQVADAGYYDLPDYQPPVARLPAPTVVTVPRYTVNDHAQLWQAQEKPAPVLRSIKDDGKELTVPFDRLQQFIKLPTPVRKEWTGDRDVYGRCAEFCSLHGLLTKQSNGGWLWDERYTPESRRAWVAQFSGAYRAALPHRADDEARGDDGYPVTG